MIKLSIQREHRERQEGTESAGMLFALGFGARRLRDGLNPHPLLRGATSAAPRREKSNSQAPTFAKSPEDGPHRNCRALEADSSLCAGMTASLFFVEFIRPGSREGGRK